MLHINWLRRLARLSSVSALFLVSAITFAQSPAPRIRGPIEASPSIPLEGSLNPHVRVSEDLGPLAPDTPIRGVTFVFKRTSAQDSDLQQLLADQTNSSSPLYHQWLTPEEFAARFGIADADIAATESWLQSRGFTVDSLSRSHDRITFSGNATQIQQAFGAELHRYLSSSDTDAGLHFAPATELSLPPALAPVAAAVLHLSDFRPKPSVKPLPDYTTLTTQSHFLGPKDIATMYNLAPLSSTNNSGVGQSLAIVGQSYVKLGTGSSVGNFQATFGSGANITSVIVPSSGVEAIVPGDVGESEIDLEYSSTLAPAANIFFVYTGTSANYNVFDALAYAIGEDIAPVISVSYGGCEPLMSTTDLQQYNLILQQAAVQGQTVVASSGDTGPTACADYTTGVSLTQQQALAVSFPASSPYVTAVGGTQMAPGTFAAGTSNYWASATVVDNTASLLSYVPEVVWNEDSTAYGLGASGGGSSSIFPRATWQTGVSGIPSGNYRLVPDISLLSGASSPGYVICTDDSSMIGSLTDCTNGMKASNGLYVLAGGTSFAAPIFAAFLADLNQYEQSIGFGNINPILYGLAAQPSVYASVFHDITSGTTACAVGDGNCGTPGTSGYAATSGYDMATGLGSVDFGKLATAWPSTPSNGAVATSLAVFAPPALENPGATNAVTVNVNIDCTCTPPQPSGNLNVLIDGVATSVPLTSPPNPQSLYATATFNFVAPSTTGSHVVVVRYPGDAYHLASSSTFAVLVGNVIPSGSLTLSANNLILVSNGSGSTQITITPSGGYTGALTWSASASGGGTVAQTLCYGVQSGTVNGPTTAAMKMGVGTACGSSASSSSAASSVQRTSLQQPSKPTSHRASAAATFLALLGCVLLPSRRRRKLLPLLSTGLLAIIAATLTGCGSGSGSSGTSTTGTSGSNSTSSQLQVYTITIKATDSVNTTITATTSFTLTVNN